MLRGVDEDGNYIERMAYTASDKANRVPRAGADLLQPCNNSERRDSDVNHLEAQMEEDMNELTQRS